MDRAEAKGLGVAVVGHAALLAALTWGLTQAVIAPPSPPSMEVSFVDDVALTSASPAPSIEPPTQSQAPEAGPTEDAAPAPEPAPPAPSPAPRQAAPAPSPERAAPQPIRQPPTPRRAAQAPSRATPGTAGTGARTQRSLLGPDLLRGIGRDPAPSRNANPPGAVMSAQAAASIGDAIKRQVQPCADRQINPGPGAERIATDIRLRINRDGSLGARPRVLRQTGVDDENSRYAQRVADLAINSFVACAPLRGLPPELYDVPNGWNNFTLRYRLPT
jgi:type IV secretory pathway VirB10-like protein